MLIEANRPLQAFLAVSYINCLCPKSIANFCLRKLQTRKDDEREDYGWACAAFSHCFRLSLIFYLFI